MIHFLTALIHPLAVLMLAVWVFFLFQLLWGGVGTLSSDRRVYTILPFIAFLVVTVVAFIAWAFLVFA